MPPRPALETLLADGKVRAIGVANYMVEHLTTLLEHAAVVPAVNQIESHPWFQQRDVQACRCGARDPHTGVAPDRHHLLSRRPAQVMIRRGLQHGRSVIPKSTKPSRIAENINVFDLELSVDEMAAIDGLDTGTRGGPEPDVITSGAFGREIAEA